MRMECDTCGTELPPNVRYCHKCGARVAGGGDGAVRVASPRGAAPGAPRGGLAWQVGIPWAAAGAAVGALVTLLVMRDPGVPAGGTAPAGMAPSPLATRASDISQLSPEERATRLFNRVMRLAEENKTDSVAFFLPMALQTYAQLPLPDVDARYHVGLLHLVSGDAAGARAQADTIQQMAPTHLFAPLLRARAAETANDARAARRAFDDFRRHERDERARGRPEYADHAETLDAFSQEAARATANR
jgi:hypothetical protein